MTRKNNDAKPTDYAVGYGKPPAHTRFQKGQSGNPKGRPKGAANLATSLERAMSERVVITENGQRKTISKLDAAVKQVVNKAASGDPRAFQQMVSLSHLVSSQRESDLPAVFSQEADLQVMQQFIARFQPDHAGHESDKPEDTL